MNLGAADEDLRLVRMRCGRQEGRPAARADHVGTDEGMSKQSAVHHVGNELLDRLPVVALVTETLDDRLSAHLVARTILVQRELEADFRVCLAELVARRRLVGDERIARGHAAW